MNLKDSKWIKGTIYKYAGTGIAGYSGDGGKSDVALLNGPAGLAIDNEDNVFVAEIHNNLIRKIDAKTRIITTVVGCALNGFDGGLPIIIIYENSSFSVNEPSLMYLS